MEFPKSIDELRWQPAGTTTQATIPSELGLPLGRQSLRSKLFIHERTAIKEKQCFLVLQVAEEEAILGPVGDERLLQELFEKRQPKTVRFSCADLLRLLQDEDPTEADKELVAKLKANQTKCRGGDEEDEGRDFFLDLCSYIKDRNLYRTVEGKGNTSLSKE